MAKTDTDKLVQELGGMTVLDLVELKNKLEETQAEEAVPA